MNKCCVKIKFKRKKEVEDLVKAFLENFDARNSIKVNDLDAELEIVFQEPPKAIISKLNLFESIELKCSSYGDDERKSEKTEPNEQKHIVTEKSESVKSCKKKSKSSRDIYSVLEEAAQKSTSFENFAEVLSLSLKIKASKEFMTDVILAANEINNVRWSNLERYLKSKNLQYTIEEKKRYSAQIRFNYGITLNQLLEEAIKYKEYPFKESDLHVEDDPEEQEITEEQSTEETSEKSEELFNEEVTTAKFKMECMPKIKEFEEVLENVDRTMPVKSRVREVLEVMGLNELPVEKQEELVEAISRAVKKEDIASDIIFSEDIENRTNISVFINNYVKKYEEDKKIKVLTFIYELQQAIMLKNESLE